MLIRLENEFLKKYPKAEIGFLMAKVKVQKTDPMVENLKQSLRESLQNKGINATNFAVHPSISIWRKIYEEDFQVKPKSYRSSIEALLRRIVTGKEIWNICNIVDLYNCCSILSLLPMGGYDLRKISGDIKIRYAKDGEIFQGLGEREKIQTKSNHIVYADDKRILCWLWNHKDSADTCIDETTEQVLFFIDSAEPDKIQTAIEQLSENLKKIQCVPLEFGILNHSFPYTNLGEL